MAEEKQPIKVWHVEDDESWQKLVARNLTEAGYEVTTTTTVREAKEMINAGGLAPGFAVAILDGSLETGAYGIVAKGKEVADLLREQTKTVTIGIIGLSSFGETPWADVSLSKNDFKGKKLLEIIAQLVDSSTVKVRP